MRQLAIVALFFFFQAEDGIRDYKVTGVQTCALPISAQPAAFRTTDATPCFTRLPQFPDAMEAIQLPRSAFESFGEKARSEGIQFLGGCCGCNAAYVRAVARGLSAANNRAA